MLEWLKAKVNNVVGYAGDVLGSVVSKGVTKAKKEIVRTFTGEFPIHCGNIYETKHETIFIGNRSAEDLITDLDDYIKNIEGSAAISAAFGTTARDQRAVKFNEKVIKLLKMYRKELENFKKFDYFKDSTLKRLENTTKKMKEILNILYASSKDALKKYSDGQIRDDIKNTAWDSKNFKNETIKK